MALLGSQKKDILKKIQRTDSDTGSPEVQIALLTSKIHVLNEHLKRNIHDFSSKHGLLKNIGQRRRLLRYLSKVNQKQYEEVLKVLKLRK